MKTFFFLLIVALFISFFSCEKVSENVVELSVDYSWDGLESCNYGNPEIRVNKIPKQTKYLKLHMYDHEYRYDHGTVEFPYADESIIVKDRFKKIQGPCPPYQPGEYEITIKALDENKIVIGVGAKTRYFPEKE